MAMDVKARLLILFSLLFVAKSYLFSRLHAAPPRLLPVFHHMTPAKVPAIEQLMGHSRPYSLSLRSDGSMDSLKLLLSRRGGTVIGASTVTTVAQIQELAAAGVAYISTTCINQALIAAANANYVDVFAGVKSFEEACQAIEFGASALKVYPMTTQITTTMLTEMVQAMHSRFRQQCVPIYAAGGVDMSNCLTMLQAGVDGVIVGFDMSALTMEQAEDKLSALNTKIEQFDAGAIH